MRSTTVTRVAATGLLALLVAACGGSAPSDVDVAPEASAIADGGSAVDPNEPEDVGAVIHEEEVPVPGTTLDACQIVTPADIQAAFALPAVPAAGTLEVDPSVLSPNHTECTYEGDYGRLIVSLTPEDGANLYDAAYGAYDGLQAIEGLGDGAFWSDDNHRGFVWQDRVTAMFTIFASDADLEGLDLTESLGRAMLGKL